MNFKTFIQKVKTDFPFRKKVLLIWGSSLVVLLALVFVVQDTNMAASVMNISKQDISRQQPKQLDTCSDTDGGKNHGVFWIIYTVINWYAREEADTCNANGTLREWFCGNPWEAAGLLRSENYVNCPNGCNYWACSPQPVVDCTTSENIFACNLWLASCPPSCTGTVNCTTPENVLACDLWLASCPPSCTGTSWYGYGYGYNRNGGNYWYGYGYGYKKIDPKTNKPWMYLLVPFKTYTKAVYDSVVSKLWFQMVKSYNKKEFKAPATK